MKQYVLKKDSLHFKIASFDNRFAEHCNDICDYIRTFSIGLAKIMILLVLVTGFIGYFLYGIGNIIGVLLYGYELHPAAMVPPGVVLALVIVGSIAKLKEYLDNRDRAPEVHKEPGFVKLAYRKFKDKTCARIVLE